MKFHHVRFRHVPTNECTTLNILKYSDMETARKAACEILSIRLVRIDRVMLGTDVNYNSYRIQAESIKETDLHM